MVLKLLFLQRGGIFLLSGRNFWPFWPENVEKSWQHWWPTDIQSNIYYTVLLKYCTELNNAGIAISMTRNVVGVWDLTSGQLNTLISKVGMHSFLSKSVYNKWICSWHTLRVLTRYAGGRGGFCVSSHVAPIGKNLFGGWRYSVWQKTVWVERDGGFSTCISVRYLPATEGEWLCTLSALWKFIFYRFLKGQGHDMTFFWRSKHQYFLCMRWWYSRTFKSFSLSFTTITFLFASLKLLTHFKNSYLNPTQNFLLCDWSMFSIADLSLTAGNVQELTCPRRIPVWFYRITDGHQCRLLDGFSKLASNFRGASFQAFIKKEHKIVKTISSCTESIYLLL
jgi:hypothetical protein